MRPEQEETSPQMHPEPGAGRSLKHAWLGQPCEQRQGSDQDNGSACDVEMGLNPGTQE